MSGKYINPLENGEMSEPFKQFFIYLKPNQKVSFVEENKDKIFTVDTNLLTVLHDNVRQ